MIAELLSAYQGLKSAKDIADGIHALDTRVEVQTRATQLLGIISDLQGTLLDMQTQMAAMAQRNAELEQRLLQMQHWQREETRYRLHRTDAGGFVYRYQGGADGRDEPPHELCADCYQKGIKSILQAAGTADWHLVAKCQACGAQVLIERLTANVVIAPIPSRFDDF